MSFIDNFGATGSNENFSGNDMMFDQMNSSQMKFDYPLVSDGIENPDFDERNDFMSADPRFNSSENDPKESIMSESSLHNSEMSASNARSLNVNLGMMQAPTMNSNNGSTNPEVAARYGIMPTSNHMGVPGSIGMSGDYESGQTNGDMHQPPHSHHNQLINPMSIEKPQYSQPPHKSNNHAMNAPSPSHHSYTPSHNPAKPLIASEFTPPFVVDLPMVRRTMEGVNRALGVDLTGNDVGESVLMAKPNGDFKADDSEARDSNTAGKTEVSHARLITEACGFIVASVGRAVIEAAHESCLQDLEKGLQPTAPKPPIRKKRGGIIGFKELASRSNLSAWHFHRVFRSVTGVTPKAYGEALWEYLMLQSGFDLENEELTISRTLPPSQESPVHRKDVAPPHALSNGPPSSSSESPQSQGLSPGLSSATSVGSKIQSPPRSAVDSRSLSRSRASSPSDVIKSEAQRDEPLIKNELKLNDSDPLNTGSAVTDGEEPSTKSQTSNNHPPLAGTVVPGRVSKTASRSRGARSRSRNRSQSQSQVFNAFKSENGVVSDEKQPIRRGRSFSRVSQRPAVLTGSSMNRTSHSVGGNPSMMTPMMQSNNGAFSPVSSGMNNGMNNMNMGMNNGMNNMNNGMNTMNNMNNVMNNGMNNGMGMMNNGMMMKNSPMSMSDDFVGDTFHPNTEMMLNNPNFAFDVPDLNNLTLYSQDGRVNHRYSAGAEQMQMLMPMSGDTGVEMPDSITTPQGIFPVPRSNSMASHTNPMAHRYPLNAEDPFDFSALPPGSGGMDSFDRESDNYGDIPNNRHSKSLTNMSHLNDMSNLTRNAMRGRHHHSQSEQIQMPQMPYTTPSLRGNPDHDSSESANPGSSNARANTNARNTHHRSHTTMDNLAFDNDRMSSFQNLRSVTPPSLVNSLTNTSSSTNTTNPPSSSSTTSTNLPHEGSQRADFFYPGNLNWDMYNDPNDTTSKSDQLGDLPPSFYGGFGDSPIFGEDGKSGNDIMDLHSVMIGEEEPPLPTNWQNDANLGYNSY